MATTETFAVAMIARNAEQTIGRALESALPLAQSLYVLDTGSTDRTISIARECGAQVHEMEWPGRFDVVVNAAYDLVKEDWTIRLDSDEWLLPGAGELLRGAVLSQPGDLYSIIRVDQRNDGSASEALHYRMMRTSARLRLVGRIHEHIPPERMAQLRVRHTEARFGHTGFLEASNPEKLRRNVELTRIESEERPGDWYYAVETARTLMQLHDPEGVAWVNRLADRLLEHQNEDEMPEPLCGDLLASALDAIPDSELSSPRTDALVRLARGWACRLPGATWAAAQLQLRRKRLCEALDALLDLEQMLVSDDYDRVGGFHRGVIERATWQNLALVAHQLGRVDVARRNYSRWLLSDPGNAQARQNLAALG